MCANRGHGMMGCSREPDDRASEFYGHPCCAECTGGAHWSAPRPDPEEEAVDVWFGTPKWLSAGPGLGDVFFPPGLYTVHPRERKPCHPPCACPRCNPPTDRIAALEKGLAASRSAASAMDAENTKLAERVAALEGRLRDDGGAHARLRAEASAEPESAPSITEAKLAQVRAFLERAAKGTHDAQWPHTPCSPRCFGCEAQKLLYRGEQA